MGGCLTHNREEAVSRRRSEEIDRQLAALAKQESNHIKILLLGAGESGKSTLVKQMKIIHSDGFAKEELLSFRPTVMDNLMASMKYVLSGMGMLRINLESSKNKVYAQIILSSHTCFDTDFQMLSHISEALQALWNDRGVKLAVARGYEYQLNDSALYLFENMERICSEKYIPTPMDVLRARVRTNGIIETNFHINDTIITMLDVGGQRSQRRKWIYCFENVKAVLFVVSLSGYDMTLLEDARVNRLEESLALFSQVVNNRFFRESSFVLFLNKLDLFREKILYSGRHLRYYFPEYKGKDYDVDSAALFIQHKFALQNQNTTKVIYPHYCTATDTSNVQVVFQVVMDTVLKDNLVKEETRNDSCISGEKQSLNFQFNLMDKASACSSRKRLDSFKCCVKKIKKKGNCPTYENEHSIYQKEISLKIEEFRLARKNWLESRKEDETRKADEKDGFHNISAYRGRFTRLKKIGFNTIRLREHYQTVKPLPYFTLKPEISETYLKERKMEKERLRAQWERAKLAEQEWFDQDTMLKDKKEQIWEEKEKEIKDLVEDFVKEKKKKKRKGPSQKAIENLKASKQADRLLETCKCYDKKEVTVVIKGFCLCDKGNLNTLKLNKISTDIRQMESRPKPEREESEPHVADSLEIRRKRIHDKPTTTEEEVEEMQKVEMTRSKSAKSVSFGPSKTDEERDNEWKLEKAEQKREPEERRREKLDEWQEERRKEQEKKEQEERKVELEKRRKEQKEKEQEEKSKEKKKERPRKREEEKEQSRNEDDASVITLFRNRSPKKSEMALTQEQLKKMKEIPE